VIVIEGESDIGMCHGWDIFFEHRLILLLFYWQFIEPKRERQPVYKPDKPLHERAASKALRYGAVALEDFYISSKFG
jgi:hypothetical protein